MSWEWLLLGSAVSTTVVLMWLVVKAYRTAPSWEEVE